MRLEACVVSRADVHAELGEVVAGKKPGRESDDENNVFDSTGYGVTRCGGGSHSCMKKREAGLEFRPSDSQPNKIIGVCDHATIALLSTTGVRVLKLFATASLRHLPVLCTFATGQTASSTTTKASGSDWKQVEERWAVRADTTRVT